MKAAAAFRGQPLLVLAGLLGAWLAVRLTVWQPVADATLLAVPNLAEVGAHRNRAAIALEQRFARSSDASARLPSAPVRYAARGEGAARPARRWTAPSPLAALIAASAPGEALQPSPVRAAVGHTLLFAASLSQLKLPATLGVYLQGTHAGPVVPAAAPLPAGVIPHAPARAGSRWSADAWLMVRGDTATAVASGRPSYGRSQAGTVVRYRLAPASAHGPQAHARASTALAGPLERDLAVGLSARPLPQVPLRAAVEARVSQTRQGTELRPAAVAVTELPAATLARGLRAEAYVQGGYVGGTFATAFVDGQGRLEGRVTRFGEGKDVVELTAGAGAWGGAQKGVARLDVGPTAAVSFRLGDGRARVAADYRFRVAGDADPRSGPALTLSAGF